MRYNQPFGNSNMDAAYVNGNPETGVMGSIPPAESIEYPQREIVNFVNASGLTPSNADLFQLAKAVQSGFVNYGVDGGAPNAIAITPVVPVGAYHVGQRFVIKVSYGNTSAVTVNVSGLGNVPLIHTDLTPLVAYEIVAGQLIEVAYDGANFQAIAGVTGGSIIMTAPQNLYVNATTGDDTLYDGTSPTIGAAKVGPFRTIDKALTIMKKYNLGGWNFTINIADGVYTKTGLWALPTPNGSGYVVLRGNTSNPAAVSIFNTGAGSAFWMSNSGNYNIAGFAFRTTAQGPGDGGNGIWIGGTASCFLGATTWNSCVGSHLLCGPASTLQLSGVHTIAGGAACHLNAATNGVLLSASPTVPTSLNITAAAAFSYAFASASNGAQCVPVWDSITGAGNVTGPKYIALGNGVINAGGRGATYLPGSTAGTVSTGGQYL